MFEQLLPLVTGLLGIMGGGGVVAALLKYRVQARQEDRVDFSTLLSVVEKQRDEAWDHIRTQDRRIEMLEIEIHGLRIARDLDPFPNWVVDLQGRYSYVNREFEHIFLEPRGQTHRDIVGKLHKDVWPDDFCKTLSSLDAAARKRPDGAARATAQTVVPGIGRCTLVIHKFPIRFKGAIVAFAGYITAIDCEDQLIGMPEK